MCEGSRTRLHNKLRDVMLDFARKGLLSPSCEPHPFARNPSERLDICFSHDGVQVLCDCAVTHALRPDHLSAASSEPGGAAKRYEAVKRDSYGALVNPRLQRLLPVVVDTFGAWGPSAVVALDIISRAYGQALNIGASLGRAEVYSVLNLELSRHIARLLLAHGPCDTAADETQG
jgi:hypothetical protein